jgi:hypothetical protein
MIGLTADERLRRSFANNPDWTDLRRSKSLALSVYVVKAFRETGAVPVSATEPPQAPTDPAPTVSGAAPPRADFTLAGVHLLSRKPLDVMKGRLYGLQKGVGYRVETLCHAFGCSADGLREHAKKHNALRYVEATPGEYVAVIVHPETKGA